jgi:hypothetical protein
MLFYNTQPQLRFWLFSGNWRCGPGSGWKVPESDLKYHLGSLGALKYPTVRVDVLYTTPAHILRMYPIVAHAPFMLLSLYTVL